MSRCLQLFRLLPPGCTPHGGFPRPPRSLRERIGPVRRLEGDVELAALAGELVDRAPQLGDVDSRGQLDLAERVALRLLGGCERELAVHRVAESQDVTTRKRVGQRLTVRSRDRQVRAVDLRDQLGQALLELGANRQGLAEGHRLVGHFSSFRFVVFLRLWPRRKGVETAGVEPAPPRCKRGALPPELHPQDGVTDRTRTDTARFTTSGACRYTTATKLTGTTGLEPAASRLTSECSSRLSYAPKHR